jgi:hypothetical protein
MEIRKSPAFVWSATLCRVPSLGLQSWDWLNGASMTSVNFLPDVVIHFSSAFVDASDKVHRTGGIPLARNLNYGRIDVDPPGRRGSCHRVLKARRPAAGHGEGVRLSRACCENVVMKATFAMSPSACPR